MDGLSYARFISFSVLLSIGHRKMYWLNINLYTHRILSSTNSNNAPAQYRHFCGSNLFKLPTRKLRNKTGGMAIFKLPSRIMLII